jgi:hypothetical protein
VTGHSEEVLGYSHLLKQRDGEDLPWMGMLSYQLQRLKRGQELFSTGIIAFTNLE